ncbi:MAG: hypothetical protein ACLFRI_04435 [Candidatus Izemoplasmataceae bacterium]
MKLNNLFKHKLLIYSLAFLVVIYFFLNPATLSLRESIFYRIIERTVISLILIYYMAKKSKNINQLNTLILSGTIFLLWLPLIINHPRLILFIYFLFSSLSYLLLFISYLIKKTSNNVSLVVITIIFINAVYPIMRIRAIDGKTSHFWELALTIGIILMLFTITLVLKHKIVLKNKQDQIFLPLVVFMFTFLYIFLSLNALNYTLDSSEPEYKNGLIINKSIDAGYRTVTSYELVIKLTDDDEILLEVSESDYERLNINDLITIHQYEGFLDIPYYIYED